MKTALAASLLHRLFTVGMNWMGAELPGPIWQVLKHFSGEEEPN